MPGKYVGNCSLISQIGFRPVPSSLHSETTKHPASMHLKRSPYRFKHLTGDYCSRLVHFAQNLVRTAANRTVLYRGPELELSRGVWGHV
jgi:hypothetical protein